MDHGGASKKLERGFLAFEKVGGGGGLGGDWCGFVKEQLQSQLCLTTLDLIYNDLVLVGELDHA